jgi:outer membrane protein OmpA-like peptidoglycan-associated protein
MDRIVAKGTWTIEFETGKATIRPDSIPVLEEMLNQIAVTSLQVEVRGHTDNVGQQDANLKLSRARADAVKGYLMTNAASGFPDSRVRTRGLGDTQPIGSNATADGRAKNRRVEVILGTTGS